MKVIQVNEQNMEPFARLMQAYEAECSFTTGKKPDSVGLFEADATLGQECLGFLCYDSASPVGLAVVNILGGDRFEVREFYVVPSCRKQYVGQKMAHYLWDQFQGHWVVRRIKNTNHANYFWRKAISRYTHKFFEEDSEGNYYWGFKSNPPFNERNRSA